jgi:GDP-mannose 4,6 dehydratase
MLQQPACDDYVLGTNETHTVQKLCEVAFGHVGLDWREHVKYDARYERSAEVDLLDWQPGQGQTRFKELIGLMVEADLALLEGTPMHLVDSNISSPKHLDVYAEVPLPLVDGNATALQTAH